MVVDFSLLSLVHACRTWSPESHLREDSASGGSVGAAAATRPGESASFRVTSVRELTPQGVELSPCGGWHGHMVGALLH